MYKVKAISGVAGNGVKSYSHEGALEANINRWLEDMGDEIEIINICTSSHSYDSPGREREYYALVTYFEKGSEQDR